MNRTVLRRGSAVAFGGLALAAGIVVAGQPASAASDGGSATSGGSTAPGGVSVPGAASAASTADTRDGGGVSTKHLDGACNLYSNGDGDLCLWWTQNFTGSRADFFFADNNLNDNTFLTAGGGQGQRVGNNAESVWNYDRHLTAQVWTGVNYTGTAGTVGPNSGGNFTPTFRNNVESFKWV
ncbi:conserved exported hypothetical protein [Frankia canadensis]|uniref:Peptidase inhibitor family I36 n=1 Tax=Frankia canadensis TaxID=1836972 RepID=A0A2I2KIX1_9ACTN|nr:peptidase inhibitor family I36 protein [Frankia canadensis]SNQ45606.1 conserved exported hypothetical protein [Frankia canadensis]SOU52896.1 conserved exported hypothetical protein [Frankia canadensis]